MRLQLYFGRIKGLAFPRLALPFGVLLAAICASASGQSFTTCGSSSQDECTPTSVSVGIGTGTGTGVTPVSNLQVVGTSTLTNVTFGAAGAGALDFLGYTSGNQGFTDFDSNIYYTGSAWALRNTGNDGWITSMNNVASGYGSPFSAWGIYHMPAGGSSLTQFVTVTPGGNVGIGTTDPANLLSVHGTIQAEEVLVNTGWSDYVFAPDYRLRPLSDVAAYIAENHHLPEIPSEAEVKENGVSLGEMQSKLLAKIEELTLHVIREDARNDELDRRNRELQERIGILESRQAAAGEPKQGRRDGDEPAR